MVKHRILEPKWDKVGVLGKGGLMLISEIDLDKYGACAGVGRSPITGSQVEQGAHMGLEGRGYCNSSDKSLATETN